MEFLIMGGAVTLYALWGLIANPPHVFLCSHSIAYENATTSIIVAVPYVIATFGALFFWVLLPCRSGMPERGGTGCCDVDQSLCVHIIMVRVRGIGEYHCLFFLSSQPRRAAGAICRSYLMPGATEEQVRWTSTVSKLWDVCRWMCTD